MNMAARNELYSVSEFPLVSSPALQYTITIITPAINESRPVAPIPPFAPSDRSVPKSY